jgi:tetratricopeptide (TPR) repeat protein
VSESRRARAEKQLDRVGLGPSAPLSLRVAFGFSLLLSLILFVSPLTTLLGVENALVHGVFLPPVVAVMSARITIGHAHPSRLRLLATVLRATAMVLAPPLVLGMIGALWVRWCTPIEGLSFFLLGPVVGALLAALSGVFFGLAMPSRSASVFAFILPIGVALLALARFYDTPAIYAYEHFVGYFPGTLYDPDISIRTEYRTFRLVSLVWVLGLGAGIFALPRRAMGPVVSDEGESKPPPVPKVPGAKRFGLLALLAVAGGIALEAHGPALGHRSTAESIREVLGSELHGERCTVVVPSELPLERAERLRDDCDFRVRRTEEVLGLTHPGRITAYFFRSEDEKRRLMGASSTYVAKPWRDEVYLQIGTWPHPVLHHEIVHVVVGATGVGPFRVAGAFGGLLPAPGIIEGVAVALAWDESEGLTPHEWAAALARIGHAPSISSTTGLRFLLEPASRAYTANGSFVRWILETRGNAAVRRLYREGDYESALDEPIADLEAEWLAFLDTVPLPPEAEGLARLRFERVSIWSQICPHTVAALEEGLAGALLSGDDLRAIEDCEAILSIDPGHASAHAWRVAALARAGRIEEADAGLSSLIGVAPTPIVNYARNAIAEAEWRAGATDAALARYRASESGPVTDEALRQLEVQILALQEGGETSAMLLELFAPSARSTHDPATLMSAIGRVREVRSDGLADYLEGRQLVARERFDLARPLLDRAARLGLPTSRTRSENERLRAIAAFAMGDREVAERLFWNLREHAETDGARVEADDWRARLRLTSEETSR